jgi:hypothetical protein
MTPVVLSVHSRIGRHWHDGQGAGQGSTTCNRYALHPPSSISSWWARYPLLTVQIYLFSSLIALAVPAFEAELGVAPCGYESLDSNPWNARTVARGLTLCWFCISLLFEFNGDSLFGDSYLLYELLSANRDPCVSTSG